VRFDGVLDPAGHFRVYEIQGGCGWIGYAGIANPAFKEARDAMMRDKWPPLKLLMPPAEHMDDELWLERIDFDEAMRTTEPLMIRRWLFQNLDAARRMALIGRSVKPMFDQNSKAYGLEFGWWKRISCEDAHALPWDVPFVLKPGKGMGSSDVMIWLPHERRGRATRTQILDTLHRKRYMYIQEFIPPMELDIEGARWNMMLRPFFGYDPVGKEWRCLHGVWVARPAPNLRLHGAHDAISGPLIVR
jgi:hypothetical protein